MRHGATPVASPKRTGRLRRFACSPAQLPPIGRKPLTARETWLLEARSRTHLNTGE